MWTRVPVAAIHHGRAEQFSSEIDRQMSLFRGEGPLCREEQFWAWFQSHAVVSTCEGSDSLAITKLLPEAKAKPPPSKQHWKN